MSRPLEMAFWRRQHEVVPLLVTVFLSVCLGGIIVKIPRLDQVLIGVSTLPLLVLFGSRRPIVPVAAGLFLTFVTRPAGIHVGLRLGTITVEAGDLLLVLGSLFTFLRYREGPRPGTALSFFASVVTLSALIGTMSGASVTHVWLELRPQLLLMLTFITVQRLVASGQTPGVISSVCWTVGVSAAVIVYASATGLATNSTQSEAHLNRAQGVLALGVNRFQTPTTHVALALFGGTLAYLLAEGSRRRAAVGMLIPSGVISVVAYSRNSPVGLAAALLFAFSFLFNMAAVRRLAQLIVAGAALSAMLLALSATTGLFAGEFHAYQARVFGGLSASARAQDSSVRYRQMEDVYAGAAFRSHPVIGQGLGTSYHPPVGEPGSWFSGDGTLYVHNGYLWLLVKMGTLGLIGYLSFVVLPIFTAVKRRRWWRGDPDFPTLTGLASALLLALTISFFAPQQQVPEGGVLIGLLAGAIAGLLPSLRRRATTRTSNQAAPNGRPALA